MPKKILIIIPARGGSKGIPRKNLRTLNGKPLIYYSIKNAIGIDSFDVDCYVSSDDDEILLIASKFEAKTVIRDEKNTADTTTLDPVIYQAYHKIKKIEQKTYDYVITLQPTSPLLKKDSIEKAILALEDKNLDTIISGVYDSHLTWIEVDGQFKPNYEERLNRQDLPKIYKETGGFVITKPEYVQKDSRFGERIEVFPLSKKESIDIDDYDDWSLCEYYLKRKIILFVVAGNSKIGMGHVYNTLSIANEILNHRVVFLVSDDSQLAFDKISESNYEVYLQKHKEIIGDIDQINPDIVINDRLDTCEEYILSLKERQITVINFEDLGNGTKHVDLLINAMYRENKILLNHYFGSKYFILRDEFLYTLDNNIIEKIENVLISFGGVDPNNFTKRVLRLIYEYCFNKNINIIVVAGMGYAHLEEIKEHFPKAIIKRNIANMSDEIAKADLVFTSAGRTTFEVASIGTPCIVLCQNKRETTHFFASEENGFYNLGLGENVSDNQILNAFKNTMSVEVRKLMHKRMIDNQLKKGKSRVLKLINKIISN